MTVDRIASTSVTSKSSKSKTGCTVKLLINGAFPVLLSTRITIIGYCSPYSVWSFHKIIRRSSRGLYGRASHVSFRNRRKRTGCKGHWIKWNRVNSFQGCLTNTISHIFEKRNYQSFLMLLKNITHRWRQVRRRSRKLEKSSWLVRIKSPVQVELVCYSERLEWRFDEFSSTIYSPHI